MIEAAIEELVPLVGVRKACEAAGESQGCCYRRHRRSPPVARPVRPRAPQAWALSGEERDRVREVLNSPEHVDEAPAAVYAKLLDEGVYLASVPTMYRVLRAHERRRHATHPAHKKPELIATAPNQVWSWDITKLAGPAKWTYFYLYVITDIFSRYVPGWMLARAESDPPLPDSDHQVSKVGDHTRHQLGSGLAYVLADERHQPDGKWTSLFLGDL